MAKTITIDDLKTDNLSFDDYFRSFGISRQTDGNSGVVYQGTLSVQIYDSTGHPFKTASLTKELGVASKSALMSFIKSNYLADLKEQEGL